MTQSANELLSTRLSLLLRLKQRDDRDRWQELVKIYGRLIRNVAARSGLTSEEADDAVQETLISLGSAMPDFKRDRSFYSFKSWFRHLAQKRIADQFRKRPASRDPHSLDWDEVWDAEWRKQIFESALAAVKERTSPQQFQIFDCYVLKQWPVSKVVHMLRVSSIQVYLAKFRVVGFLRKEVRRLERGRI